MRAVVDSGCGDDEVFRRCVDGAVTDDKRYWLKGVIWWATGVFLFEVYSELIRGC